MLSSCLSFYTLQRLSAGPHLSSECASLDLHHTFPSFPLKSSYFIPAGSSAPFCKSFCSNVAGKTREGKKILQKIKVTEISGL